MNVSPLNVAQRPAGGLPHQCLALVAVSLLALLLLTTTRSARAESPQQRSIGFSNLVFRVAGDDDIGIAEGDFRVHILEELRKQGLGAVGAESLVFGKDRGDEAELLLGGTVRELECVPVPQRGGACRVGIDWELLDVRRDVVVYRALTRFAVYGFNLAKPTGVPTRLVLGALRSLVQRPAFRALMIRSAGPRATEKPYPAAEYQACNAAARPMPLGADAALDATVVVTTETGFGSGFFLNTDGHVVTAAHVVADAREITVKTRLGASHPAELIRISRRLDVALLRVRNAASTCVPVASGLPSPGADVYAVGSPASEQLAFSVTRGIVSGARSFDDVPFLQTDASISPGNSGGPLVDQAGKVAAIVSWKVVGGRVEGIAFGVPASRALEALGVSAGKATSETLTVPMAVPKKEAPREILDAADPVPSLDPEGDAQRKAEEERRAKQQRDLREMAEMERREVAARELREEAERARAEARERRIDELTPGYVKVMKWGGLGLAAAGGVAIVATSAANDEETTTKSEFETLRWGNDIGWVALGLGAASFGVSYALIPALPEEPAGTKKAKVSLDVGSSQVRVRLCY